MADLNPHSDNPYECLGISKDASETEVGVAAAKAKNKFNPDHYPEDEKDEARLKLYRVRAAEEAISGSGTYPPNDELAGGEETSTGQIAVGVSQSNITVGETITVTAEVDENPLKEGIVKVGSREVANINRGSAKVSFETPGNHTISVSDTDKKSKIEAGTETIEVNPEERSVSMFCEPSDPSIGETVQVEIRYDDGTRVSDAIVETSRGHSVPLNRGRAELVFEESGEVTVEAIIDKNPKTSTTINISETELQLTLEPIEPTVSQGESIKFTVRDEKGRRVEGAKVSNSEMTVTTNTAGQAKLVFKETGSRTVSANKPDTIETYLKATTDVMVEAAEVKLAIELLTDNISIGDTVRGTVWTETGSRASGVIVSCLHVESGSRKTKNTDKTGNIEFKLDDKGTYKITAGDESTESPYISDSKTITLKLDILDLTIIPARTEAAVGEEIRFTVRDNRGERVEYAHLQSNGKETKVDGRGVGRLQFNSSGEFEVTATKEGDKTKFNSGSTKVKITD